MSNFKKTTLGEVVSNGGGSIRTGPFGSQLHASDYVEHGIPCIMPANMKDRRVNLSGIARITQNDANRLSKHLVKCGDIVYSRRGDVTQKALISQKEEGYFCGTGCLLIRPGTKVDSTYLTYYLSTPVNESWIVQQAVGATMPNLNTGILERVPLLLPDLLNQQKIAKVLSTLDAKIELNNQINAELEGMAKLLYDYWFVQFDFPMTAAQATSHGRPELAGQSYKSSGGKMVFNPTLKREIPDGWEAGTLSNIAQIIMGQSPPGESYNQRGEGTLFFQGSTDFGWRFPTARQFTTQPTRHSKEGDILLSVRAPVGTMNVAPFDCAIGRGLAALRSKSGHDTYLFSVMGYFKQIFDRRNGDGTTFGSINKDDLHSLQVVVPESVIIENFEEKVRSGNTMIANNQKQNQELTELRDWLLPMLMNGQVTVK
jgi:type I restriction enzyme S subunit